MIKTLYASDVRSACEMLEVSDKDIRAFSNGAVTCDYNDENAADGDISGTLTDPEIFGEFSAGNIRMGYIPLPVPVVNINYLYGARPFLPKELGLSRDDTEAVIYFRKRICIDPESSDYKKTEAVFVSKSVEEKNGFKVETMGGVADDGLKGECLTGAEAIEMLLPDDIRQYAVLHSLPVVPLFCRYRDFGKDDTLVPAPLEYLYENLLRRSLRVQRLIEMCAPDVIILNEKHLLQEAADRLINNGVRGLPYSIGPLPCDSLYELHEDITSLRTQETDKKEYTADVPAEELTDIVIRYKEFKGDTGENMLPVEMDEETFSKYKTIEDDFINALLPLAYEIAEKDFGEFKEYKESLIGAAFSMPHKMLDYLDPDDDFEAIFIRSFRTRMEMYAKKRIPWEEK